MQQDHHQQQQYNSTYQNALPNGSNVNAVPPNYYVVYEQPPNMNAQVYQYHTYYNSDYNNKFYPAQQQQQEQNIAYGAYQISYFPPQQELYPANGLNNNSMIINDDNSVHQGVLPAESYKLYNHSPDEVNQYQNSQINHANGYPYYPAQQLYNKQMPDEDFYFNKKVHNDRIILSDKTRDKDRKMMRERLTFMGNLQEYPRIRVWVDPNAKNQKYYDCDCNGRKPIRNLSKIKTHLKVHQNEKPSL